MEDKTDHEMIREIWQGLYGVPETDERGCVGEIREINEHLKVLNGEVKSNSAFRRITLKLGLPTIIIAIIGIIIKMVAD